MSTGSEIENTILPGREDPRNLATILYGMNYLSLSIYIHTYIHTQIQE